MAGLRVLSKSRCLLSRSIPSIRIAPATTPTIREPVLRRKFSLSAPVGEDIIQTPSRGPEIALTDARVASTESHGQAIALMKLAKRLTRSDIEKTLRSTGCNIKRFQMRIDRFTFHNDTMCFVELGSEEEAAKAVERLNGAELQGKKIVVKPLKADFQWGPEGERSSSPWGTHLFYDEADGANEALKPLAEGRRFMLRVATPGWTTDSVSNQKKNAIRIIQQTFDKYGVEKISQIHPFYGDIKFNPRLLCFMDFKTKEGADEAVRQHHDTDIEGRKTWLTPCIPSPYRTHHIAKVAPKLATDLQEQGILPEKSREDRFVNPLSEKESR